MMELADCYLQNLAAIKMMTLEQSNTKTETVTDL